MMNDERRQWLKEQLADKSECQLFNFGMQNDKNCGWDIHGDVVDLLEENEALSKVLIEDHDWTQEQIDYMLSPNED